MRGGRRETVTHYRRNISGALRTGTAAHSPQGEHYLDHMVVVAPSGTALAVTDELTSYGQACLRVAGIRSHLPTRLAPRRAPLRRMT